MEKMVAQRADTLSHIEKDKQEKTTPFVKKSDKSSGAADVEESLKLISLADDEKND